MKKYRDILWQIKHYTIGEIMMVVAIFMIVLALITAAWQGSGKEVRLRNAAMLVSQQLEMARAKAISERQEIGVHFNLDNGKRNHYALGISKYGQKKPLLAGEEWESLPSGVVFTTERPGSSASTAKWPAEAKRGVIFRPDGSLSADSSSELEVFYVVAGNQSNGAIDADQPYYEIVFNKFTGRVTLTYREE